MERSLRPVPFAVNGAYPSYIVKLRLSHAADAKKPARGGLFVYAGNLDRRHLHGGGVDEQGQLVI